MEKFFLNFKNSINGLKIATKEHSFIAELIGGLILIPYVMLVNLDNLFKLIIIATYLFLLAFELVNTSIEKLGDKISKDFDPDIKKIKDISSASVFVILLLLIMLLFFSILFLYK